MKIGLSSAAYYGQLETDDAAAHIAELPLDTCEVFLETPSEYTTDFTFRMRYNMNNFPVTSVHPLGTQFEPQLFGRAARQSDDAFAMFANVCRAAESLGAAYYIFHGPFGVRGHLSPANIPFLEERFDQMRERAARHHLACCGRASAGAASPRRRTCASCSNASRTWSSCLTPNRCIRRALTPSTCCAPCVGMLRHLHVLDWTADGKLCLPGRGVFDWQQFARVLREDGFDGAVILEPYAQLVESEQALLESIRFLRGVFDVPAQM
ncbi:MAG: sugar phosphate isomerase/epimerase family protein [Christensenellales bacterium]